MNNLKIIITVLFSIFLFTLIQTCGAKPFNVLFILVDDMGARDLSNEGSAFYESPNIDRIANEGMKAYEGDIHLSGMQSLPGKYPYREHINQSWHNHLHWNRAGKHGGSQSTRTVIYLLNTNEIFGPPRSH